MTQVVRREGTPNASNTVLPVWDTVYLIFISPSKLKVADDLRGADVTLNNSSPQWDNTGLAVKWGGASASAYTRKADGASRTSLSGIQIATINLDVADMRVMLTINNAVTITDNPGMIFRYVDASNYWVFQIDVQNNVYRVTKVVANVSTNLFTGSVAIPGAQLEIRCNGNTISAYVNSSLLTSFTDAQFNTAKVAGFRNLQGTTGVRFLNFMGGSL